MIYTLAEAVAAGDSLPSPARLRRRVLIKSNGILPDDHPPPPPPGSSPVAPGEPRGEDAVVAAGGMKLHPAWAALVALPLAPFHGPEHRGAAHVAANLAEGRAQALCRSAHAAMAALSRRQVGPMRPTDPGGRISGRTRRISQVGESAGARRISWTHGVERGAPGGGKRRGAGLCSPSILHALLRN